jgi:5-oxoprolinase (ATP-hydrolysing) subunit C
VIEVVDGGLLTSVQDPVGRTAWRRLGVPVGGALDPWAARLANRLVDNPDGAAVLECTIVGPTLRLATSATVALVGRLDTTVDSLPFPPGEPRVLRAGSVVRVGSGAEARGWLAVRGGIDVPEVLGGRGTDLRSGFGGHDGRALRAGDRLAIGAHDASGGRVAAHGWRGSWPTGPIRVTAGPNASDSSFAALVAGPWELATASDRTGARLVGAALRDGGEVPSMGLPLGAIQVPPDGGPIIGLADRPVTGGYRVPAVVIGADIGRVARLAPGDALSFAVVSRSTALQALRSLELELARIG